MTQQGFQKVDYQFALIMNELKIKSGLVYRKHTGELVGFCDLGKVNQELDELATAIKGNHMHHLQLAQNMLAFMIWPVFKPSMSFMVTSYASLCL